MNECGLLGADHLVLIMKVRAKDLVMKESNPPLLLRPDMHQQKCLSQVCDTHNGTVIDVTCLTGVGIPWGYLQTKMAGDAMISR